MKWTDEMASAEAAKILKEQQRDVEVAHACLDDFLCKVLVEQGFEKLVKVYEQANKWYA